MAKTRKEIEHIFKQYKRHLDAWREGYVPRWLIDDKLCELYNQSGYTDVYDFVLDFKRWEIDKTIKKFKQLSLFDEGDL